MYIYSHIYLYFICMLYLVRYSNEYSYNCVIHTLFIHLFIQELLKLVCEARSSVLNLNRHFFYFYYLFFALRSAWLAAGCYVTDHSTVVLLLLLLH